MDADALLTCTVYNAKGMQTTLHACLLTGVLQVEAMAQLGGILMIDPENETAKNNFFFGGIDNCKWRKPVVPGDCLVSMARNLLHQRLYAKTLTGCHATLGLANQWQMKCLDASCSC